MDITTYDQEGRNIEKKLLNPNERSFLYDIVTNGDKAIPEGYILEREKLPNLSLNIKGITRMFKVYKFENRNFNGNSYECDRDNPIKEERIPKALKGKHIIVNERFVLNEESSEKDILNNILSKGGVLLQEKIIYYQNKEA